MENGEVMDPYYNFEQLQQVNWGVQTPQTATIQDLKLTDYGMSEHHLQMQMSDNPNNNNIAANINDLKNQVPDKINITSKKSPNKLTDEQKAEKAQKLKNQIYSQKKSPLRKNIAGGK